MTRLLAVLCLIFLFFLPACKDEKSEGAVAPEATARNLTVADESKGKPYMYNPEGLPISSLAFIAIDADGDGVELTPYDEERVPARMTLFDVDEDSLAERTGWVAPDDAILFVENDYFSGVEDLGDRHRLLFGSGLKNIRLLDRNNDGIVTREEVIEGEHNANKGKYIASFDKNSDGLINQSEYKYQKAHYVTTFNLKNTITEPFFDHGHYVEHVGEVTWNDGKVTKYWVVRFAYEDFSFPWSFHNLNK